MFDMTSGDCPDSNLLKPYSCETNGDVNEFRDLISCGGNEDIDLVQIFQTLSKNLPKDEKHFFEFFLNNTFNDAVT